MIARSSEMSSFPTVKIKIKYQLPQEKLTLAGFWLFCLGLLSIVVFPIFSICLAFQRFGHERI